VREFLYYIDSKLDESEIIAAKENVVWLDEEEFWAEAEASL